MPDARGEYINLVPKKQVHVKAEHQSKEYKKEVHGYLKEKASYKTGNPLKRLVSSDKSRIRVSLSKI